jgi:hypothetical protein
VAFFRVILPLPEQQSLQRQEAERPAALKTFRHLPLSPGLSTPDAATRYLSA